MPKYDAFGREIGEDTLGGLGGSPSPPQESSWEERAEREQAAFQEAERAERARQEAAADAKDVAADQAEDARQAAAHAGWTSPTAAADEGKRRELAAQLSGVLQKTAGVSTSGMPTTVTVRRSGSAKGCLIALIVLLAIGGAAVAGIVSLVNTVDVSTSGGGSIISVPKLTEGPQPKGLEKDSLMRKANVAAALRQLRSDEGTKLTNLRLAPERIDATLLTSEGRLRHVQVKPGGKVERFGGDSGPGFDTVSTIPYARLNPGAPQRLARRGAEEVGVPISELQYAVPTYSGGDLTWVVYFTRGRYVLGDARGRYDRKFP